MVCPHRAGWPSAPLLALLFAAYVWLGVANVLAKGAVTGNLRFSNKVTRSLPASPAWGETYWAPVGTGMLAPQAPPFPMDEVLLLLQPAPGNGQKVAVAPPKDEIIELSGVGFVPRVLAIAPGTPVTFVNRDRTSYMLFSPGNESFFGAETLPVAGKRVIRFLAPGVYYLRTKEYLHMHGVVVVQEHGLTGRPDGQGRFSLVAPAPGSYRLQVLAAGQVVDERTLTVGAADTRDVTLDIEIKESVRWPSN